jgi:GNAT superfamily N-acetyltransferase
MGAGVVVRAADAADVERLAELFRQLGHPVTGDDVRRQVALMVPGRDRILVAERDGHTVGAVALSATPFPHEGKARARVTALVVDAPERGAGVGAVLLRAAEELAGQLGCAVLELTTGAERSAAHRFYEREGYRSRSVRFSKYLD